MDQPIKRIVIRRQDQKYGPYPIEEVKNYLSSGQLLPTDMASLEGAEDWRPLPTLLGPAAPPSPPMAPLPSLPTSVQPVKPPWFRRRWFHVLLFLIVPYVQVPLMWIVKAFSLRSRIIVTVIGCVYAIVLISNSGGSFTTEGEDPVGTGPPVRIIGNVISVLDDGVLVDDRATNLNIIFLKGVSDKVDGDFVALEAISIGTYKYTSAVGSAKTVRAFRVK